VIPQARRATPRSLAAFIIYNLIYGAASVGVDNSAHVGGLLAGAIVGAIVPPLARLRTIESANAVDIAIAASSPAEDAATEASRANRTAWGIIFGSAIVLALALAWVHKVHMPYAQYGEAAKLIRSGHAEQATAELQQIVRSGADMPFAPMLLGEVLLDQGNPGDAATVFLRAITADPTDLQSTQNLAVAYVQMGHYTEALAEIDKVVSAEKNQPGWDTVFIRGICEGQMGTYTRAAEDLQAALQANPELSEARDDIARFRALANHSAPSTVQPLAIPYSELVAKSENWPLFP
jgi:rhomboid protease GluP